MDIHPWDASVHLPVVESWLAQRGIEHEPAATDLFPPTGFVVDDTLVGFMYRTDAPGVGYLDSFAANPTKRRDEVRRAMIVLVARLQEAARAKGVRLLCGSTAVPSILEACEALGWSSSERRNATFVSISLKGAN